MTIHQVVLRKRGFAIVEVVVAVAIVAILATLVTVNFTESRRTARDGNRKTDISTILNAVSQYATTNGSSLITYKGESCKTDGIAGDTADTSYGLPGEKGCVGARGRAYGKVNLYNATPEGSDGANQPRPYGSTHTIIEALNVGGYFNADPKDPTNKTGKTMDRTVKDYVLIRACPNGQQHVGTGGQLFAVWTYLERQLTAVEQETRVKIPGDVSAIPSDKRGSDPGDWGTQYDFAVGAEYPKFEGTGYAVSNGVANWNLGVEGCSGKKISMAGPGL